MTPAPPIEPVRTGPLSPTQRLLWDLHQMVPASALNISAAAALAGPLDPRALEEAFYGLIARHEPLRTRFVRAGDEVRAQVMPPGRFGWEQEDLEGLPLPEVQLRLHAAILGHARRPFDLGSGEMVRGTLIRLAEERWAWLLSLSHICADGWGLVILSRDLSALYRSFAGGRPCRLGELEMQSLDYSAWQLAWQEGPEAAAQLGWWETVLGDPPLSLLALAPQAEEAGVPLYVPTSLQVASLPPRLVGKVHAVRRRHGLSVFMLTLAAFKLLLSRWGRQEDVVVGTLVANREHPDSAEILGAHYNTVLLRTHLGGDPTPRELLERVARAWLEAYDRQGVPFSRVAAALTDRLGLAQGSLLRVMFQYDESPFHHLALAGVTHTDLDVETLGSWLSGQPSPRPRRRRGGPPVVAHNLMAGSPGLAFHVREKAGGLELFAFYKMSLFADETVRWAIDSYLAILTDLVDHLGRERPA